MRGGGDIHIAGAFARVRGPYLVPRRGVMVSGRARGKSCRRDDSRKDPMPTGQAGQSTLSNTRLDGWKSIAAYTARSERQLQRWAAERRFPVHRVPGGGSVFAWTDEIDTWFVSSTAGKTALQEEGSDGNPEPANGAPPSRSIAVHSRRPTLRRGQCQPMRRLRSASCW
jgi:hypothetical protein